MITFFAALGITLLLFYFLYFRETVDFGKNQNDKLSAHSWNHNPNKASSGKSSKPSENGTQEPSRRIYKRSEENSCNSSPCLNGGTCRATFNSYFCYCQKAYHGQKCQYTTSSETKYLYAPMVVYSSPKPWSDYFRMFIFAKTLGDNFTATFDTNSGFKLELDPRFFKMSSDTAREVCRTSIKKIEKKLDLKVCDTLLNEYMMVNPQNFAFTFNLQKDSPLTHYGHLIIKNGDEIQFEENFKVEYYLEKPVCYPYVSITGCGNSQESSLSVLPTSEISMDGVVSPNVDCPDKKAPMGFMWKLFKGDYPFLVDPDTGKTGEIKIVKKEKNFFLDPFSLEVGNYTMIYTARVMYDGKSRENSMMCWLKVEAVPVIPVIKGGSYRLVNANRAFVLDASLSSDPVPPPGMDIQLTYKWSCNISSESICQNYTTEDPVYSLGISLRVNFTYEFTLFLSSSNDFSKPASITQVVEAQDFVTSLLIVCIQNCENFIDPHEILILKVITFDAKPLDPSWNFTWAYKKKEDTVSKSVEGIVQKDMPFDSIAVREDSLDEGSTYIFRVRGGQPPGQADIDITTAVSPTAGSCFVEPQNGTAGETYFTISCSGFSSNNGLKTNSTLNFKFYEEYSSEHGDRQLLDSTPSGASSAVTLSSKDILITAEDITGTSTDVKVQIQELNFPSVKEIKKIKAKIVDLVKNGLTSETILKIQSLIFVAKPTDQKLKLVVIRLILRFLGKLNLRKMMEIEQMILCLRKLSKTLAIGGTIKNETYAFFKTSYLLKKSMFALKEKVRKASPAKTDGKIPFRKLRSLMRCVLDISTLIVDNKNDKKTNIDEISMMRNYSNQNVVYGSIELEAALVLVGKTLLLLQGVYLESVEEKTESQLVWIKKDSAVRLSNVSSIPTSDVDVSISISQDLAKAIDKVIQGEISLQVEVLEKNLFWWRNSPNDTVQGPIVSIVAEYDHDNRTSNVLRTVKSLPEPIDIYFDLPPVKQVVFERSIRLPPSRATADELDRFVVAYKMSFSNGITYVRFRDLPEKPPIYIVWLENEYPTYSRVMQNGLRVSSDAEFYLTTNNTGPFDLHYVGLFVNISEVNSTIKEIPYKVELYSILCRHWDETGWASHGCEVKPDSTLEKVHCSCEHLTFFSASVFVTPHFIDPINDIHLFWTIKDNYFVSSFVLGTLILYFTSLLWTKKRDKEDKLKEAVIVLEDNNPEDEYFYLITVITGFKPNSGTSANVALRLIGKYTNSKVHVLNSPQRKTQAMGSDDWFLLCVPEPLVDIIAIQIWHDNSGPTPDWYLLRVEVRDPKEEKQWSFIGNRWLSVLNPEETLYAEIKAASPEELTEVSSMLKNNVAFGFQETHTWFSIYSRYS